MTAWFERLSLDGLSGGLIDYPFKSGLPGGVGNGVPGSLIDYPFKSGLPGGVGNGVPGSLIDYPFKSGLPGGVGYGVGEAVRMRRYQTVLYMSSSHAVSTCVDFNQIRSIYSNLIVSEKNTSSYRPL